MAKTHFKGTPVDTAGELPTVGSKVPSFTVVGTDLADITEGSFAGKRIVLNIFPSIDTGVCAQSVRRFNEEVSRLENANVVCVSADLPFALDRFCGAEGIENVTAASSFRSSFGSDFGVTLTESPLAGLLARAVIVVDEDGTVIHSQLVNEIGHEPDYDAAIAALS
ncbi:MAG: thiol peroxidase [Corynebacterium sp.]|uniref:thiol peroxidase n=1 Tax=Corynebacterium sp. TaxID=1720 RepID=UPI0026DD6E08|nr:thiol peroxidase [Corynebacterium sp.]MDO5097814.1 thiol peroxidase [Corynebacterium sp.]